MFKWLLIGAIVFLGLYASAIYVKSHHPPQGSPDNSATLSQTSWIIQDLAGPNGFISPPPGTTLTAEFDGHQISGNSGCNSYSGTYTEGPNQTISIGSLATTMMACDPPIMDLESQYLNLLQGAATFSLTNNQLIVLDGNSQTSLVYNPYHSTAWENVPWMATGINNGKPENAAVVSTSTTSLSTATFAQGTISGFGGCNQFSGPYQVNGPTIKIGPLNATLMTCPLSDQEQQFLTALEKANQIESAPGKLTLRQDENTMVSFNEATN